ncbi:MAG TPA: response regulator transcription factor [Chitinophagaceae bacterium]|nr:response regulator transcription factor [Chitinophagaceae bacterium]
MHQKEILVIDDEIQIQRLLEITLSSNGYKVHQAGTAKSGLAEAAGSAPDLIILDLGLPDESGQSLLLRLREWFNKPILILSVQDREEMIVQALDNGANDYMVKPFRTGELMARVRSCMRSGMAAENQPVMTFRDLEVNLQTRTVKLENEILKLTSTQYLLIALFAKNEGKVLTHQYILKEIWGAEFIDQLQYLRVYIAQLRRKLEKNIDNPQYIITESGIGYRFVGK